MAVAAEGPHQAGLPRSEADADFLARYEPRMRLPIILSAVLPLIIVPQVGSWVGETVGVVTWLVFLVDYVVHVRHIFDYRRTRLGRFDLLVVVLTAPWYLIPGAHVGSFVVVLRLARLARPPLGRLRCQVRGRRPGPCRRSRRRPLRG